MIGMSPTRCTTVLAALFVTRRTAPPTRPRLRRILLVLAALMLALPPALRAAPARAAMAITLSGHFVENASKQAGCAFDVCGTGWLMPLGKATDADAFASCGNPVCGVNTKTFYLADGTLILAETFIGGSCSDSTGQGTCGRFIGQTSNVIVGGTGAYAGASGTLLETFSIANISLPDHSAIADYTGTLILP